MFCSIRKCYKKESGIKDLHDSKLVSKAFSMKVDKSTGTIQQIPLISINDLSEASIINEQDGLMHMLINTDR